MEVLFQLLNLGILIFALSFKLISLLASVAQFFELIIYGHEFEEAFMGLRWNVLLKMPDYFSIVL